MGEVPVAKNDFLGAQEAPKTNLSHWGTILNGFWKIDVLTQFDPLHPLYHPGGYPLDIP